MRICYLSSTFPKSEHDSWAFFMRELAQELSYGKNDVIVITQRYRESVLNEKIGNIIIRRFNWLYPQEFTRIADFQKIPYLRMVSYLLSGIFQTIRTVVKEKLDIIYAHWAIPSGFIGLVVKYVTKRPLIIQIHGSDVRGIPGSWAQHSLLRPLIKFVLGRTNGLVAVSNDLMKRTEQMNLRVDHKRVIPVGIDLKTLEKTITSKKKNEKIPTILFVGALREVKGLNYLIDALPLIKRKIHKFKLILAGDGPIRSSLENQAKFLQVSEFIFFIGQISHKQVLKLMKSSNFVILPSLSEGTPTVMFEALACKTPLIATRVGGIPEVITHNKTGILIEPRNTRAIADAIIYLWNNKNIRQNLAKSGYTLIKNQYTIAHTAKNLLELFMDVLRQ